VLRAGVARERPSEAFCARVARVRFSRECAAHDVVQSARHARRALARRSLGRYVLAAAYDLARPLNPVQSSVNNANRSWTDTNGNYWPDCDLANLDVNGECGRLNNSSFGQVSPRTAYDPALSDGFAIRPYNWEGQLSVQHELLPRLSVSVGYFRRWFGNFDITQNRAVTTADFSSYCVTAPVDARLPGGGGQELCGFYDVNPDKFGQTDQFITFSDNFGDQKQVYDGVDLNVNARLQAGILVTGGVSLGRTRTDDCFAAADLSLAFSGTSPRTEEYCDVRPPFQPNVKGSLVYPLPFWGVRASATFQSLPGPEISATRVYRNPEIAPSLGRNLSAGPNGSARLGLVAPGTLYGERVYQVDLRFSKSAQIGRTVLRPTMSIYNLFNANPVLRQNNNYGPSWQAPTAILTARFVDFGIQVDF
jgi:hypothetical protein